MELLTEKNFTQEFCNKLLEEYETKKNAAEALQGRVFTYLNNVASVTTIERYILRGLRAGIVGREDPDREARIEHLLNKHNIPLTELGRIESATIGMWGVHVKNEQGKIETRTLDKTQLKLVPSAPAFPIQDKAEPRIIMFERGPTILRKSWQCVVISDTQIGFLQNPETKAIQPIHDPIAILTAQQITSDIAPKKLAWIGDLMDWPFLSRWQQHDEFDAVNESIQAGYDHLCTMISAAGPQLEEKILIGGNHDIRPERFLLENNRKAMRVRRAADTSRWSVFSQGYLLRYEDLGIHYPGHYPGDHHYLLEDLVLTHAPPKANEFQASVIHGHTHHITRTTRVQHAFRGRQTHFVYDTGCLCQVGEYDQPRSLIRLRTPSDRGRSDWAQGISVVNVVEGKGHSVDQVAITNGFAIYGGQIYDNRSTLKIKEAA